MRPRVFRRFHSAASEDAAYDPTKGLTRRLGGVGERDGQRDRLLRTDVAEDVSLPGSVFGEQDAARPEPEFLSSVELDLAFPRERHDVLAARRGRPVIEILP